MYILILYYTKFHAGQATIFLCSIEIRNNKISHEVIIMIIIDFKNVHLMMPFGPHLVSIDESSMVKVWDIKSEELFLELKFSNKSFQITTIMHPSTYINKILLGSEQGSMQLWNLNSSKLIYNFKGWDAAITCLEQAPALDVVAVGLFSGKFTFLS